MSSTPPVLAAISVAAGVLAWLLAVMVLRAALRAPVNRLLAGVLALEGALQLANIVAGGTSPTYRVLSSAAFVLPLFLLPWLYLLFLARLEAPLARPLLRVRRGIVGCAGVFGAAALAGIIQLSFTASEPDWIIPFVLVSFLSLGAASLFGLFVAGSAWRHAPHGTLARERAGAYALAFGTRDLFLTLAILAFFVEEAIAPSEGVHIPAAYLASLATLLFVPLLAYGILRARILGIEARVRWTISRGTVAAAFVAVYIVASQAAALLLAPRYGPMIGVVAAGLLVTALVPLQRFAERLAAAAVPEPAPALDDRRLELYRLALLDLQDAEDPAARQFLVGLRRRLGLTERDHTIVEHFVRTGSRVSPAAHDLVPGDTVLGRFRVLARLGEGGQARALLAEDLQLGRRVVLKAFRPNRPDEVVLREARAVAGVRHANVVTVHDVHLVDGQALLVLEHVEGGSLRERLALGPLARAAFERLAFGLLDALESVHAAGMVHRDVKPGNVLLTREGRAKLADFGIATLTGAEETRADALDAGPVGTLRYMSPEQAKGLPVTPRTDQYALALTLYEALVGRPYFEGESGGGGHDMYARVARPGPFKGLPGHADGLEAWFRRALEPSPSERFADIAAMRDALAQALRAAPSPHES